MTINNEIMVGLSLINKTGVNFPVLMLIYSFIITAKFRAGTLRRHSVASRKQSTRRRREDGGDDQEVGITHAWAIRDSHLQYSFIRQTKFLSRPFAEPDFLALNAFGSKLSLTVESRQAGPLGREPLSAIGAVAMRSLCWARAGPGAVEPFHF
jgi:hypothetical protein